MCGIVGYIGQNEAAPVLIKGLKKLEYRGYDSAGIAVFGDGIHVVKTKGRLADLDAKVQEMGGVKVRLVSVIQDGQPMAHPAM